jgi:soluble lytic murein transglycosylase-like protein/TolA-binding protein
LVVFFIFSHSVGAALQPFQEEVTKPHHSKQAKKLKQAYQLLQAHKYAEARNQAAALTSDPVFADVAIGITIDSLLNEATQLNEHGHLKDAASLAGKLIAQETKIQLNYPASPYARSFSKNVGQAELIEADLAWSQKQWKQVESLDNRAFERFYLHSSLTQIPSASIEHYGDACAKKADEFCKEWLLKFSNILPHQNDEIKAIARSFPDLLVMGRPPHTPHVTQSYKAPDLDTTAFDAALALYLGEKYGTAASTFQKFLDDFPKSSYRFRVRFLLASSLMKNGKKSEAVTIFDELGKDTPLSFYGMLSAFNTDKPFEQNISSVLPPVQETDPFLLPAENLHLKRAQFFAAEEAADLAAQDLKEIKPRDGLSSAFLLYLASLNSQVGNYGTCFQILSELVSRGTPDLATPATLQMIFPVVHYDLIEKYSALNKLDPVLVLSLIKQESAFDEKINSGVGAQGLMQLMPGTAAEILGQLDKNDLLIAEKNIAAGTAYLAKLLVRFNGNIVLALAGYNAGPAAAERWYHESQVKKDELSFIETIPYKETREYVQSIIRNYYWYAKKMKDPDKPLSYFWAPLPETQ